MSALPTARSEGVTPHRSLNDVLAKAQASLVGAFERDANKAGSTRGQGLHGTDRNVVCGTSHDNVCLGECQIHRPAHIRTPPLDPFALIVFSTAEYPAALSIARSMGLASKEAW